jgi:EAL domain-containing protein (putative c-di-GMP-specific phosphodiesterase class I)
MLLGSRHWRVGTATIRDGLNQISSSPLQKKKASSTSSVIGYYARRVSTPALGADMTLAVNVSATQLRDAATAMRILAILAEVEFNPRRLELEITETALIEQIDVAQNVIQQLRKVRIALDDFGTGYATLSQLLALRIDRLKIDRRFVSRLGKESSSAIIVRAILGLANEFGLATTAEGIEDHEQLAALKATGCQAGQGHFFATAVPADAIPSVLERVNAFCRSKEQPCR